MTDLSKMSNEDLVYELCRICSGEWSVPRYSRSNDVKPVDITISNYTREIMRRLEVYDQYKNSHAPMVLFKNESPCCVAVYTKEGWVIRRNDNAKP